MFGSLMHKLEYEKTQNVCKGMMYATYLLHENDMKRRRWHIPDFGGFDRS